MMEQGEEDSEMSYIRLSADNETATRPKNGVESKQTTSEPSIASQVEPGVQHPTTLNAFQKFNARLESLAGLESRGIERVEPDERQPPSMSNYMQMSLIWLSANMTANNLTLGLLGPLSYDLGFVDSAICAVLGGFVGSVGASTMGIWGATSGNRTLIVARYFMGYYPSKIAVLLNIIIMVGYGMVDCIISGQLLSAVSGGSMSIVVGIIISAIITWVIAVFGMAVFHHYERWAWLPQAVVLFILVGCAGPKFNTSLQSTGDSATIIGNRLSFFSLCLSSPIAWTGSMSDFYVYYPADTAPWKAFTMTCTGMTIAFSFVYMLGVGLASGVSTHASWANAYNDSDGQLILVAYEGLGGFGKFCAVIIALGLIANNIPGTYSSALGCQMLGRYGLPVPRYLWTCVIVIIYTVLALVGQNYLYDIFENWLALMGYWVVMFITIVFSEHFIFRRGKPYDWSAWNNKSHLPIGYAALASFCIGWVGAVIGMDQVYFVGPVAALVGDYGADMGLYLSLGFTQVSFLPLRYLELKYVGR